MSCAISRSFWGVPNMGWIWAERGLNMAVLTDTIIGVNLYTFGALAPNDAYIVLLSRTESSSLAVIVVMVKIQIGRMTTIDQGNGKEVV